MTILVIHIHDIYVYILYDTFQMQGVKHWNILIRTGSQQMYHIQMCNALSVQRPFTNCVLAKCLKE